MRGEGGQESAQDNESVTHRIATRYRYGGDDRDLKQSAQGTLFRVSLGVECRSELYTL